MTSPSATIAVKVSRTVAEADGIVSFEMERVDGGILPAFEPGSHIDVHIPGGFTRQYSLCNPSCTNPQHYVIAVLRDPASRGGSESLHAHVTIGTVLNISPPRNHFCLSATGPSLLMGGGIGITPLLCMADRLAREGRPFEMHYCTRTKERTAFYEELQSSSYAKQIHYHFDDGDEQQKLDIRKQLSSCSPDTHLYVCGPKGFMDAVLDAARELGWPDNRIHYEYFAAEVVKKDDDESFEVEIASTGLVVTVGPQQSIVAALGEHGIDISMSCEQGVCGTCVTRVISGIPDHRDTFLLPAERAANNQIAPCCSRSKSARIVLDL